MRQHEQRHARGKHSGEGPRSHASRRCGRHSPRYLNHGGKGQDSRPETPLSPFRHAEQQTQHAKQRQRGNGKQMSQSVRRGKHGARRTKSRTEPQPRQSVHADEHLSLPAGGKKAVQPDGFGLRALPASAVGRNPDLNAGRQLRAQVEPERMRRGILHVRKVEMQPEGSRARRKKADVVRLELPEPFCHRGELKFSALVQEHGKGGTDADPKGRGRLLCRGRYQRLGLGPDGHRLRHHHRRGGGGHKNGLLRLRLQRQRQQQKRSHENRRKNAKQGKRKHDNPV